jgi:hypothetical protein
MSLRNCSPTTRKVHLKKYWLGQIWFLGAVAVRLVAGSGTPWYSTVDAKISLLCFVYAEYSKPSEAETRQWGPVGHGWPLLGYFVGIWQLFGILSPILEGNASIIARL